MPKTLPVYFYVLLLCGLAAANVSIYRTVFTQPLLSVSVLDVGKGRAALVRTPSGKTLLIDTGPDASILRALGTTLPEWKRDVDVVILTSSSLSTAGGLPEVLDRYHVGRLVRSGTLGSKSFESALSTAESAAEGLQQTTVPYGTRLTFAADTYITIVSPGIFTVSYAATSLTISSTTPQRTYVLK